MLGRWQEVCSIEAFMGILHCGLDVATSSQERTPRAGKAPSLPGACLLAPLPLSRASPRLAQAVLADSGLCGPGALSPSHRLESQPALQPRDLPVPLAGLS